MIPGLIVGDSLFAFTKASQASIPTILVKKNDVVEVIGRSQNGVWIKILTNAGVEGWVPSAYIQVDRKQLAKLDVVTTDAGAPAGTQAATMEGTMAGTQAAMSCPGIPGTITGDLLALKTEPSTKSKDTGVNVKKGQQVEVLQLNSSGSWFKIRAGTDEGWVGSAYVFIQPGAAAQIPHNYTDVEVTLTPRP